MVWGTIVQRLAESNIKIMRVSTLPTYRICIYISGSLERIKHTCRKFCLTNQLCVTVTPTDFVYTGGEESGACIGLINYPRFPKTEVELRTIAKTLALTLLEETFQHSVLLIDCSTTEWITKRYD